MQDLDPASEEFMRHLLNRGLPDNDPGAVQRLDSVLRRCREQLYGRDTITLLFARLWVAVATLLARFLYISRGRPVTRIATYFAAAPPS